MNRVKLSIITELILILEKITEVICNYTPSYLTTKLGI